MSTYGDKISLSGLPIRVEMTLALLAFLIGTGLCLSTAPVAAAAADPMPVPQTQNLERGDYLEARQLLKNRKWPEAVVVLRAVMKKSPDFPAVAVDLARALVYSGRREEAIVVLEQVRSRQKGDAEKALVRKGRVLSRMFLTNSTFQIYQDGVNLLAAQKLRSARERFDKALGQEPDNVEILTRLGQCLVLEGSHDMAAERLRLARRFNPYEPEIRVWLGRALHQRGELTEAIEELRSGAQELKADEQAWIWYAEALFAAGLRNQAVVALENEQKSQPLHVSALVVLARLKFLGAGRDAQALWNVRRDLQVAQSRLESYPGRPVPQALDNSLRLPLAVPKEELKADIDRLMEQVELKINEPAPPPLKRQTS